jgi:dsDNA-specific endonuclease/ATPase MutS2
VRIVHGRGAGVQRATVRAILERDPRVVRCGDAADASGWGATVAELR